MKKYLWIFTTMLLSGCGWNDSVSSLSDSSAKTETIVVMAGGFNSCPDKCVLDKLMRAGKTSEMHTHFRRAGIEQKLSGSNGKPTYFSTCYTGPDNLLRDLAAKIYGRYTWGNGSLSKDEPKVTTFDIAQGETFRDTSYLDQMKQELGAYIDERTAAGVKVDLYLYGHSYGGFTVIQLADEFSDHLRGLVTIDPISMLKCQARTMVTDVFGTLTRAHDGCQMAPADPISKASIARLKDVISKSGGEKFWYHTYQSSFPLLRSGALIAFPGTVPENREFIRAEFRSAVTDGDYHSQMGRNPIVWNAISAKF